MHNPKEAWLVTSSLQMSVRDVRGGMNNVPGLVIRIVNEGLWRSFLCDRTRSMVNYGSFEEYVTADLPEGLGIDLKTLRNICRDNIEACNAIDEACTRTPGGKNQHTAHSILDNIQEAKAPTGTSRDAALRRLRKDRPDLHAKVLAGDLSAHAAAIDAGFRKKPTPLDQLKAAWKRASASERKQFVEIIS